MGLNIYQPGGRTETWSGVAKLLPGSANSATSSSATWKALSTQTKAYAYKTAGIK